jgi:hypothetical protein
VTDSELGLTGDFDVALYVLFPTICTSFDHDASETTFTGTVILNGFAYYEAFSSGSLVTTFSDTDEGSVARTLTVALGEYDTVASTGEAELVGTITDSDLDEWSANTIIASLDLELTLVGTTGVTGEIDGSIELEPLGTTVALSSRDISLTIGASCV